MIGTVNRNQLTLNMTIEVVHRMAKGRQANRTDWVLEIEVGRFYPLIPSGNARSLAGAALQHLYRQERHIIHLLAVTRKFFPIVYNFRYGVSWAGMGRFGKR
jgi:hypothetical protein